MRAGSARASGAGVLGAHLPLSLEETPPKAEKKTADVEVAAKKVPFCLPGEIFEGGVP
ncbi:MAG: hypothetical protein MUF34_02145 [Polyangiaceae bacterium]|jgi:hypothetical protein|nr:hypothetical protein [Polyangiaceae bacterium]